MKKLFMFLGFAGFIYLIGTAGASDAGSIAFSRIILQCLISFLVMGAGYIGYCACDSAKKKAENKVIYLKKREAARKSFDDYCSKAA